MNLSRVIGRVAFRPVGVLVIVFGFVSMRGTPAMAQAYVVANDTAAAVVFDALTLSTVATIPLPPPPELNFDVAVMPNQSLAFVARFNPMKAQTSIWIIDLTQHPPVLAAGINPIVNPLGSGAFVEDLSLTADGRFLVVSDGQATGIPLGVIDTATRQVIGLYNVLPDHDSVEVCDSGSVLVTSFTTRVVKRLTINTAGALVDTGQSLPPTSSGSLNVTCARGGTTGVIVNSLGDMRSFRVNGMSFVSTQQLPGASSGLNVSISSDGTKVFGRRSFDFVTAYNFNSTTGVIGAQLWSKNVGTRSSFFGVEQMTLNPTGTRLFVSTANSVLALNAATGAVDGSVSIVNPTGIAMRRPARAPGDFDGDGRSEVTVFRPSNGTWYIRNSVTGIDQGLVWGGAGDVPVPGDYDRDGRTDMAVFRPSNGTWYVRQSSTGGLVASVWGGEGDVPVQGDYDGDGRTDIAVFRESTGIWYIRNSATGLDEGLLWGGAGDVPVPGDYDADGKTDMAVFRPSNGTWYIRPSSTGVLVASVWGGAGDIAVADDYDGDGRTDIAVFRSSTGVWYIRNSATGLDEGLLWGEAGDVPVPDDYDGDGRTDMAVFRPSNGTWYLRSWNTGLLTTVVWGNADDIPVLRRLAASSGPGSRTFIFTFTGAVQTFTVPAGVTSIAITAAGAGGGGTGTSGGPGAPVWLGGNGVSLTGSFIVSAGSVLSVVVGGGGHVGPNAGAGKGGGGGGSFVFDAASSLLIAAGGGGGGGFSPFATGGCGANGDGGTANLTASGSAGRGPDASSGGSGGNGGSGGTDPNGFVGGGGGGFLSDGGGIPVGVGGGSLGSGFRAGTTPGNNGIGGFGGGGGGGLFAGGGGGGGYSGGGGSYCGGGGGGSFNNGTNQSSGAGGAGGNPYNGANGLVTITW